ncbi:10652_t:CDS:2 [Gigaspora margarita]|uniref:10652_t:CDS:1 n=1 Tax=Gigaspora margarita TaxID=4874 RepID=A0ABN7W6S8_GIGMA|nr:10652_t:CDS:2 [Gigaspora margarita]
MESNTLSISETQREHNNSLERERYAKCMSRTVEETADTGPSEKARARRYAKETTEEAEQPYTQRRASETTEEAEHRRNNQRQTYSRYRENESNEQTELCKKTQNKANNHASNAACFKNYNTNTVIPYNIGRKSGRF